MADTIVYYGDLALTEEITLSVANEVSGFPKENLLDPDFGKILKINDLFEAPVICYSGDGSAALAIKGAALFNISLAAGDTLKFQGSNDSFSTTPGDLTVTIRTHPVTGERYAYVDADWEYKKYRFLLTQAALGYITIGGLSLYQSKLTLDPDVRQDYEWGNLSVHKQLSGAETTGTVRRRRMFRRMVGRFLLMYTDQESYLENIAEDERVLLLPSWESPNGFPGALSMDAPPVHHYEGAEVTLTFTENTTG